MELGGEQGHVATQGPVTDRSQPRLAARHQGLQGLRQDLVVQPQHETEGTEASGEKHGTWEPWVSVLALVPCASMALAQGDTTCLGLRCIVRGGRQ